MKKEKASIPKKKMNEGTEEKIKIQDDSLKINNSEERPGIGIEILGGNFGGGN